MSNSIDTRSVTLERLFDAYLDYRADVEPVVVPKERDGVLVGSGDGNVTGDRINGSIRWSLYSGDCAYVYARAGAEPPPGQHLCTVYPGGIIETEDGAEIWFDATGYGLRGYDASQPHLWSLTMAVKLTATDERYQWLNSTLGLLVSQFDEQRGHAHWEAFIPAI